MSDNMNGLEIDALRVRADNLEREVSAMAYEVIGIKREIQELRNQMSLEKPEMWK